LTYRSLLVYLGPDAHCAARTRAAIALARRLDCHLVGVAPTGLIDLPVTEEVAGALAQLADHAWDTLREQAEQATQQFREACRAAGLKSFQALVDEGDKAPSLVRHAHCNDLVVLSQAHPDMPGRAFAQDLVEQVLMNSARPTLTLPYAGPIDTVGTRALVAWDDSREAARAIGDALPLLRLADTVQVVSWIERGELDEATLRPRLDALHQWLLWQGVTAEVRIESSGIEVAEAMLSRAADLSADLIVMGAYGHARWTERVFGGATRGLLQSMTAPVLMSH
jgi:nucleotide-binding universal stress UspA family protein